ncbi:MAG: hypothetical protein ACTS5I_13185 [Rhodanobacter sp.]
MNPSNNQRHAIRMKLVDGELHYKQCKPCRFFVRNADEAISLLRQGQTIWLMQNAKLVNTVQRAIEGRAA